MSYRILVADSEPAMLEYATELLGDEGYLCSSADSVHIIAKLIAENDYDIVLLDVAMLDKPNFELLEQIKRRDNDTIVVMMSAYNNITDAAEAVKKGAYDYIIKPFNKDRLLFILQKAIQLRFLLKQCYGYENDDKSYLIGVSEHIHRIRNIIEGISVSDMPVLFMGPTGSGKEYTARIIHNKSRRHSGPFIKVDCSVLPIEYIEIGLLGSDKGISPRISGALEAAKGGTIFLKNIELLTMATQKRLLEVIKEKKLFYDGEGSPVDIDVRVIASSRISIEQYTKQRRFSEELYYYLNAVPIFIPSLSQRKDDIPILAYHFLRSFSIEMGKHFIVSFHPEAMRILQEHFYLCNIRELKSMVENAVALCEGREIMPEHIERIPCSKDGYNSQRFQTITISDGDNWHNIEREIILSLLDRYDWNREKVARQLGINPRTIRNKLNIYHKEGIKLIPSSRSKKRT